MRKLIVVTIIGLIISSFFVFRSHKSSPDEPIKPIVYAPPVSIGSLYKGNPPFDKIDLSQPEGVLFAKTRVENTQQLEKIYSADIRKRREIMDVIRSHELSDSFKKEWSKKEIIFSLYYSGAYGPPHWFGIAENPEGTYRIPLLLVLNDGSWCQYGDIRKYPIRIAFFDLIKKYKIADIEQKLSPSIIDAFVSDCSNIDNIISRGMTNDPEHYAPTQIMK